MEIKKPGSYMNRYQRILNLKNQLENERTSFKSHWRDLNDYILPRRGRFFVSDANRGERKNLKIYDTTATMSARTLRSGMMSGVTSPARPWFKLDVPDPRLAEVGSVKLWLDTVTNRMRINFLRSNLYNVLPQIYGDLGTFGTGCMYVEEDMDAVTRFYSFPIGSYMIGNDHKGQVRVFIRDFRMTVRQIVDKFAQKDESGRIVDMGNISTHVQHLWMTNQTEAWIDVLHVIMPNENYDSSRIHSRYKKYLSIYLEQGSTQKGGGYTQSDSNNLEGKFLREMGYDYFPVLCPRWEITGEDVYGTDCPGMTSLGDIKQLQTGEKRSAQAIEKMVNPPLIAPSELENKKTSQLPGGVTYVNEREGMKGMRPLHEVRFDVNALEQKQAQVRTRIQKAFYEDLFLMLANTDRRQITAREIEERHEEKLLALGPVLEQLNQDLLDPLIDIQFAIMEKQGLIPPPPPELEGLDLKVEYISIMAQAQKLVGLAGIERFTGYVGNLLGVAPEVKDKVNIDQLVDVYGDLTSIPAGIVFSDEEVAQKREAQARQQAAMQKAEMMKQGAGVAKDLSQANLDGDNALSKIVEQAEAGSIVR